MADIAATGTDNRSITLSTTYRTTTSQQFSNKLLAYGTLVVLDLSKLLVTEHTNSQY